MKSSRTIKILFLVIIIFLFLFKSALADPTDSLYIDVNGDVGIGTTTPNAKVSVISNADYNAISLSNSTEDGVTKRAIITGSRKTNSEIPFSGFGTYDNGLSKRLYIGGGGWGRPDANQIRFYTTILGEVNDAGSVRMFINGLGNVGIGTTLPTSQLHVIGDIRCTGKLTSDGGNDPPYVLYNLETRQSIIERVKDEIPPDKLGGAVMFFNGQSSQMELFLPQIGEFRGLDGKLLAETNPITATYEVEDQYYFDNKIGQVIKYKVRKQQTEKYRIKGGYVLDEMTGKFYKETVSKSGEEDRIEVPKEEAVELIN